MKRNVIIGAIFGTSVLAATAAVMMQVAGSSATNSRPLAQVTPFTNGLPERNSPVERSRT